MNETKLARQSFESGWRRFPFAITVKEWETAFDRCAMEEAWQKFAYSNRVEGIWDYRFWNAQSHRDDFAKLIALARIADEQLPTGHPIRNRLRLMLADYDERHNDLQDAVAQYLGVVPEHYGERDHLADLANQKLATARATLKKRRGEW